MHLSTLLKVSAIVLMMVAAVQALSLRDWQEHNQSPQDNLMNDVNSTDEIQKFLDEKKGGPAAIFVYNLDTELQLFSRVCVGKKISCIPVQKSKIAIMDAYNIKYPQSLVIKDKWDNVIKKWTDKNMKKNIKTAIDLTDQNTIK